MIYARISGTGSCLPGQPVSNHDLVARGIETTIVYLEELANVNRDA